MSDSRVHNVLTYLERAASRHPEKVAFSDASGHVTFSGFRETSRSLAMEILRRLHDDPSGSSAGLNRPVAVLLKRSVNALIAFFGAVAAGCPYAPLDAASPTSRNRRILEILGPRVLITDAGNLSLARELVPPERIILISEHLAHEIDEARLDGIARSLVDTDLLYVIFTSGSTGFPKGVCVGHRGVIDYVEWVSRRFGLGEGDVIGNQSPFSFDLSVHDIYCALRNASTMHIIPENLFAFPVRLIEFLDAMKITTITWVPSALVHVANGRILEKRRPEYLTRIFFCGETLPARHLNCWRRSLPEALYVNLYGPTEAVVACTCHVVDGDLRDDAPLPIGKARDNAGIMVLSEDGRPIPPEEVGKIGELCIRGSCLAFGYFADPETTNRVFLQNPLNHQYPERIYRTGDMVRYDDAGNLIFLGRKDSQIKHLGYRIELGEIEAAASSIEAVQKACALYDEERKMIVLVYVSPTLDDQELVSNLKRQLPAYMLPACIRKVDEIPLNHNGKYDRARLKEMTTP